MIYKSLGFATIRPMKQTIPSFFQIGICTFGCLYATSNTTLAQIASDGTVNTQVNQNGNVAEITGGETRGSNLFHSFQDFSVPTGNQAFFNNANNISNIFSRVTGGKISNIDGLIRANGSASLFLINPAGIIFGENARLDLGGSFYGSTASSILFEDGEFSAVDNLEQPILTVNAPIGLGFRDNPGDIEVQNSNLRVSSGQNLNLLGKDINIGGAYLEAVGGRVNLGAISTAAIVSFKENLQFNFDNVSLANIRLSNGAIINVNGTGGGEIEVNALNLSLAESSIFNAGISTNSSTIESQAGNITINVVESLALESASTIRNNVNLNGFGNAGDVQITAQNLSLADNSRLSSITQGNGNSGNIKLAVSDRISLENSTIQTSILTNGVGNAGNIIIDAEYVFLSDSDILSTLGGVGNAGNVAIVATDVFFINQSSIQVRVKEEAEGNAGNAEIDASNFSLLNDSVISSNTQGIGDAGNTTINASNSIILDNSEAIGDGGDISITTNSLSVQNASNIQAILNNGIGNAGNIEIIATDINVLNYSQINVSAFGNGDGGSIFIQANDLNLDRGRIFAINQPSETNTSASINPIGGNITLKLTDNLILRDDSSISAQAFNNANGGNLNIDARFIIAFPNGNNDILASAQQGIGGNININAESLFGIRERPLSDSTNDINASSEFSLDGTVNINTPDINPLQGATELPTNIVEPEQTTAQACRANREVAAQNGLNITGKGGIPPAPDLPLDSHNISVNGQYDTTFSVPKPIETSQGKIQPARGVKVTESGEIILTAYRTNNRGERIPERSINCGQI